MRQADPGSRTPDPVGRAHGCGRVVDQMGANAVLLTAAGPLGDDLPAEGAALPIRKLTNWTRD
jgi:hypothetical protein